MLANSYQNVKQLSIANTRYLAMLWLPGGKLQGSEYVAINPCRSDDDNLGSFKVNINTGSWCDFAIKDTAKGNSPISLCMYLNNIDWKEAVKIIMNDLGEINKISMDNSIIDDLLNKEKLTICNPIPDNIIIPEYLLNSKKVWKYTNEEGKIIGFITRVDTKKGEKLFLPKTYWIDENENGKWLNKRFSEPMPLYNLHQLTIRDKEDVLIVEGEKTCTKAIEFFSDKFVCVTWAGGTNAFNRTNYKPLTGKNVYLFPDQDKTGFDAVYGIAEIIKNYAKSITVIIPPLDWSEKHDIGDENNLTFSWLNSLKTDTLKESKEQRNLRLVAENIQQHTQFPVPILAAIAREISERVDWSHPTLAQQATLAVAAHTCARRYISQRGDPCSLYLSSATSNQNIFTGYVTQIRRIFKQAGFETSVKKSRPQTLQQLYRTLADNPSLLYISREIADILRFSKRQPSGHQLELILALPDLYQAETEIIDYTEGKKSYRETIYNPTLNLFFNISNDKLNEVLNPSEVQRGLATQTQIIFIDNERLTESQSIESNESGYSNETIEYIKTIKTDYQQTELSKVIGGLQETDQIIVKFDYDINLIGNRLIACDVKLGNNTRNFIQSSIMIVRRMATILAAWSCPVKPIATKEIFEWCIDYEINRLKTLQNNIHLYQNEDQKPSTYDKVLDAIRNAGKLGLKPNELVVNCWAYRSIKKQEDRDSLIEMMINDEMIFMERLAGEKKARFFIK